MKSVEVDLLCEDTRTCHMPFHLLFNKHSLQQCNIDPSVLECDIMLHGKYFCICWISVVLLFPETNSPRRILLKVFQRISNQ